MTQFQFWLFVAAVFFLGFVCGVSITHAHDAPTGWHYDLQCCSGIDCAPIAASRVKEGPTGYTMPNGEVVLYGDRRIHESKDGSYHWCTPGGNQAGYTICLYVPFRGY